MEECLKYFDEKMGEIWWV